METFLPVGPPSKIQCVCGKIVQRNSYPTHLLSKKHKEIMKDLNRVKVERGIFMAAEI